MNDYIAIYDAQTREERKIYLTDEEQTLLNAQRAQAAADRAAAATADAAKRADFAELMSDKVTTALQVLSTDAAKLSAQTPANKDVIAAVAHLNTIMTAVVKVLQRQLEGQG